ncbi:MAG: hypothetical protein WBM67_19510 [Sedimenticolaceae bacterium]
MEPLAVVENYLEAFRRRDFEAARACLADRGFEYISPIASFDDADVFISGMDGYQTSRLVQLARVKGDRIVRLEAIFDASDFHRMIGDPSLG